MNVVKFGGSSLASAPQLQKVLQIVKEEPRRTFVVVSAPGKRTPQDIKVTDLLIQYYQRYLNNEEIESTISAIIRRYEDLFDELHLDKAVLADIAISIRQLATLPKALEKISVYRETQQILVIPGFFGYTEAGEICTFSRGGSDITGSIVAAGVQADLYENFTDVDGIYVAHPGIIEQPQTIQELTYREMRELAYAGFAVLHDEALMPAYRANIPVVIKNTNNPHHPGTLITTSRKVKHAPVVGIASDQGFASIYISKYLMNRELGFGRRLLEVLEKLALSYEHMPSGIDDITIVLREDQLTTEIENRLMAQLQEVLAPDELRITHHLSMIMIVGEGMRQRIGVTAESTMALAKEKINLEMINQGSSEVSIMFGIKKEQEEKAIKALYRTFFHD